MKILLTGLVMLGAAAPLVHAGEGDTEAGDSDRKVSEVVVTGTRDTTGLGYRIDESWQLGPLGPKDLIDTPLSLNIIPSDLIDNRISSSPDDLFRLSPVTQLSNPQARFFTGVTLRGFQVGSNKQIDGMSNTNMMSVDMEDKDRIDIMTGLSGFMFGPGNVGGTVNYILKRPTKDPFARVTVVNNGGSNFTAHGDFGGPIDSEGRFGYRLNVVGQDGDTQVDYQHVRRTFVSGAFDWHITPAALLRLDASVSNYKMNGTDPLWSVASGVQYPEAFDADKYYGQPFSFTHTRQSHVGVRFQWALNEIFSIRAAATRRNSTMMLAGTNQTITDSDGDYYVRASEWVYPRYKNDNAYLFGDANFNTGAVKHHVTFGYFGDRTAGTNYISGGWSTTLGFNGSNPTYNVAPPAVPVGNPYVNQRIRDNNVVLGDELTWGAWTALLGVTRSQIIVSTYDSTGASTSSYDKSRPTPAAMLLYKLQDDLSLYANYMEGFQQGGTASATYNGYNVVNGGQLMSPLKSKQKEVGVKYRAGGVFMTAALFDINEAFEYYDISNPTAPVYVQDGREVHRGFELTSTGRITPALTLVGGLTLLDPKIKNNKQNPALEGTVPMNVAKVLAKAYLEYDLPWPLGVTLTGGVFYTGAQEINAANTGTIPSYTVEDLGARYSTRLLGKKVTFRMNIDNLTDKHYWMVTTALAPARTFLFSAQADLY